MDFSKKTLVELREIAKEKGLKGITALRKPELIQRLMEVSEETKREPDKAASISSRIQKGAGFTAKMAK